ERDINVLSARFRRYIGFLQEVLGSDDHFITGTGINPHYAVNRNEPIPNGRYRMLFHHLSSYPEYRNRKDFHTLPNFGLIACASQTHIDVSEEEITTAINAFSRIEPLKALLFANSVYGDYLCARDFLWRDSLHGLNPRNVDSYPEEVRSVEALVDYIRSMSLFCLDQKYGEL
ncbi:MAG: glutamylcysteine synthetase, partial [Mogibacterium sp.]|nr:glutamylcysteine synthetase [Mogibacterium sp.]